MNSSYLSKVANCFGSELTSIELRSIGSILVGARLSTLCLRLAPNSDCFYNTYIDSENDLFTFRTHDHRHGFPLLGGIP